MGSGITTTDAGHGHRAPGVVPSRAVVAPGTAQGTSPTAEARP